MRILITGATGFIGGAITGVLADQGHIDNLLFLVRASNSDEGLSRLRQSLSRFDLSQEELDRYSTRQIILGDLGSVNTFSSDVRLNSVTHVVNCAAIASFGAHPQIWPINVDGTLAFAKRMSEVSTLKRFLHVSTAMACGTGKETLVKEGLYPTNEANHLVEYTASKAEAERRMRAELPSLPLIVARPSIVVGHSELGCTPSSSIFWVFRMVRDIEHFMCDLNERIDVIPVDYCALALAHLLLSDRLNDDLYHISAGTKSACRLHDIYSELGRTNDPPRSAPPYHRISASDLVTLVPLFQNKLGINNRRLLQKAMILYGSFSELHYVFDNQRLLDEGLPPLPPLTSYIERCIRTTDHLPLLEQMMDDFK